ncbi:MAG: ATP-binding protein [Pseudomonadota bacterium]
MLWWHSQRLDYGRIEESPAGQEEEADGSEAVLQRLLLDAAPTPLLALEAGSAKALNRAARRLFGTDMRILPVPSEFTDPDASHMDHEGHRWRIDRVSAHGTANSLTLVAMIDVDSETSRAEARASAELIEVLGHELLNGLAPIVSLAESARDAASIDPPDAALLQEILGPLERRAQGLQHFASDYRKLARLPAPVMKPHDVAKFVSDLEQGFVRNWPKIVFALDPIKGTRWSFDRDQLYQALWALLHNAAEAAADQPEPKVSLACQVQETRLVFDVSDNGTGVAASSAAHIFRPFHTTKPGGSGVGLSLARQIAHAHGGTVEYAGVKPTRFALTIAK